MMTPREKVEDAFSKSRTVTHQFTVYIDIAEIDARNDNLAEWLEAKLSEFEFRKVTVEFEYANR